MSEIVLELIHVVAEAHDVHGHDPELHGGGGDLPYVLPIDDLCLLVKYEVDISKGLAVHKECTHKFLPL